MFFVLIDLIGHDNLYLKTTIYNHFEMFGATADSNTTYYTAGQSSHRGNDSKETKMETNSPDSITKLLNFVSCWFKRNFMNFVWRFLWHILNHLGLLVNSACVRHDIQRFFGQNLNAERKSGIRGDPGSCIVETDRFKQSQSCWRSQQPRP